MSIMQRGVVLLSRFRDSDYWEMYVVVEKPGPRGRMDGEVEI